MDDDGFQYRGWFRSTNILWRDVVPVVSTNGLPYSQDHYPGPCRVRKLSHAAKTYSRTTPPSRYPRTTPGWISPFHIDDGGHEFPARSLWIRLLRPVGREEPPIFSQCQPVESRSVSLRIGRPAHPLGARRDGPMDASHRGLGVHRGAADGRRAVPSLQSSHKATLHRRT